MAAPELDDLQRDKLLSRLLAESLAASAANDGACPDAETVASYADQGLPAKIAAHLDSHFASCARCQQLLVRLALSSDEFPARVAALEPQPPSSPLLFPTPGAKPPFVRTHWRWLAPAAAIAAAVAIWFALRPVPPIQTLSARNETPSIQVPGAQDNAQNSPAIAQSHIPSPHPSVAMPSAALPSVSESSRESQQFSADALKKTGPAEQSRSSEKPAAASGAPAGDATSPPSLQAKQKAGGIGGSNLEALSAPSAAPQPSTRESTDTTIGNAPISAQATGGLVGGTAAPAPSVLRPQAMAKFAVMLKIFASPNREAIWRIGPGGSVQRSDDQGQTWQVQTSGVVSDLVAGAAASKDAAWIVGRSGVILRTTDGVRWQRVPFSSGTTGTGGAPFDFTAVEARDALHATVTATDGHHFATQDGGQTWMVQ